MASKKQIADLHAKLTADVRQYMVDMQSAAKRTQQTGQSISDNMGKAMRSTKTFNDAQNVMGKTSRMNGMMVQQAGYQVGDFAVQVASGQSAMRAFIQQGTQMLGVFGPGGAIAGAALAIGGVAWQMMRAGDETKNAGEELKTYEEYARQLHETMSKIRFDALRPTEQRDEVAKTIENKKAELRELWDLNSRLMAAPRALRYDESLPNGISQEELDLRLFRQGAVDDVMARIGKANTEMQELMASFGSLDSKVTDEMTKAGEEIRKRIEGENAEWQKLREAVNNSMREHDEEINRYTQSIEAAMDPTKAWREELEKIAALEKADRIDPNAATFQRGKLQSQIDEHEITRIQNSPEYLAFDFDGLDEKSRENFRQMEATAAAWASAVNGMFQDVSNRAGDAFATMLLTGQNAFKSLADSVAQQMIRIAAQMAIINPILNFVFGGFAGFTMLPTFYGGARAEGGPVDSGRSYLVGERGPELFTPGSSGTVTNNARFREMSAAPAGNTYIIDARGADQAAVARIEYALIKLAGPGVVERRALNAIGDGRRRGGSGAFAYSG